MPPKRKAKLRDCTQPGDDDDIFRYQNQIELTFNQSSKTKNIKTFAELKENGGSSSSEDDCIPFTKAKLQVNTMDSSSGEEEVGAEPGDPSIPSVDSCPGKANKKGVLVDRPITPPPEVPLQTTKFSKQGSELFRNLDNKLRSLQQVTEQDQSPHSVTGRWSDVVVVDPSGSPCLADRNITIRIRTRNGVERFSIRMSDRFDGIISELAKKQSVLVEAISLSFTDNKGNLQTLKASDSPISVTLSRTDIIDCIIVNSASFQNDLEEDESVVNIKVQGSQADTVKLFKALKNEPLGSIMQQYADFRKLPLAKITFIFDGETFTSDQTADDLEMDEDNVVDVRVS